MAYESAPIEVALFPIPNVVAFPGTALPLHVFEPRYRRLVHDCVNAERMIGVSHVRKTIHQPPPAQTLEQALSSNAATYQPREVFCAGPCEILDTTPDGRILAEVDMRLRLSLIDELQSLPYRIVSCVPLEDRDEPGREAGNRALQHSIHDRLIELARPQSAKTAELLEESDWLGLTPGAYSFKVFEILRLEPELMQTVLETRSAHARLTMIWEMLRR